MSYEILIRKNVLVIIVNTYMQRFIVGTEKSLMNLSPFKIYIYTYIYLFTRFRTKLDVDQNVIVSN